MNETRKNSVPGLSAAFAGLAAGLVLAAGQSAAAAPSQQVYQPLPVPQHLQLVVAIEGVEATIELGAALAAIGAEGHPAAVIKEPTLGVSLLEENRLIYVSGKGQFGRDQIFLEARSGIVQLEIRVLPRYLPFAARLEQGSLTIGAFDNLKRKFLFCREPDPATPELPENCRWLLVRGVGGGGLIPVAWPADKFGTEQAALYDMATGQLTLIGWDSISGHLRPVASVHLGDAGIGAWPVVGDWRGEGSPEIALVSENGQVWLPETGGLADWPAVQAASPAELLWPVVLPAMPGGKDRLALIGPKLGDIDWLELDFAGGGAAGFEKHFGNVAGGDFRRPLAFVSSQPFEGAILPSFAFLREQPDNGLVLVPGRYLIGKPQTIPIKFPDDPPTSP